MSRAPVALLALTLAAALPARADLAESWYLARGRANARIGNHAAAIEAYRKALDGDPGSREASRGLALELLRNGETDRAVAELDRHLARFPGDWELAFEQARILQWSRYAYRSRDAVRYLELGLAAHDDPARRRELARLLGRDRATLDAALAQYDRLLAASPGDPALRSERLKLLLWDPRHRAEALRELAHRAAEHPDDEGAQRELARLTAEEPGRAAEAAERYAALTARHPRDPELWTGRARALARAGRRAEAGDAYERALALRPTPGLRLEYAGLLASDPASRPAARAEYEQVVRERPGREARLGLARVLSADRGTSLEAIPQYEAALARSPGDAEAHLGLARVYAWNGDPDRALAHADAARALRPGGPADGLARGLRAGREPSLGGGAAAIDQPGGAFALSAARAFASGSAEPTPFTSSAVDAGAVTYSGDGGRASGAFASGRAEWRLDPGERLDGRLGVDRARPGASALSGALALSRGGANRSLSIEASRTPRQDSFRAVAGERVAGRWIGAASDDAVAVRAGFGAPGDRLEVTARAGRVTGDGFPDTFLAGAGLRAEHALLRRGALALVAAGEASATHHARELSGLGPNGDPSAPRLFSPPLFAQASPRLALSRDAGLAGRLVLDAGPALQAVTGANGGLWAGGDVRASLVQRFADRLRLSAELRAERLAGVYQRVEGGASLALLF